MDNLQTAAQTLLSLGIDPKTKLPVKYGGIACTYDHLKMSLNIQDEQDAISTFQWYNLPEGITSEELERLLYYKGQLICFYFKELDQIYFMPFAQEGSLDYYGRFNYVHPIPLNSTEDDVERTKDAILTGKKLKVVKDIVLEQLTPEEIMDSCVIIKDYTNGLSNTIIPRNILQQDIINIESEIIPYLRTALKNSVNTLGMRVNDTSAADSVYAANDVMDNAALTGKRFVPIVSQIEFQDLSATNVTKCEEYLESMQAIDNLRVGFHGIQNGGLFQKKDTMLVAEQQVNMGKSNTCLQNRLDNRQHFCDIWNSLTGMNIWCDVKESAMNIDQDFDGKSIDEDTDGQVLQEEVANG